MRLILAATLALASWLIVAAIAMSIARADYQPCDKYCGLTAGKHVSVRSVSRRVRRAGALHRHRPRAAHRPARLFDANGNAAIVRSRSGVAVRVAPSAQRALQCVVDFVEAAGVRIKAMRGYGPGTVHGSLHPSGRALDINQVARNRTRPFVSPRIANAAADACGVVSGARWSYADNGHWNLMMRGEPRQPWPRVIAKRKGAHS